jgi:hypothetical protein
MAKAGSLLLYQVLGQQSKVSSKHHSEELIRNFVWASEEESSTVHPIGSSH